MKSNWNATGPFVLDRLLHTRRANRVSITSVGPLTTDEVRRALQLVPAVGVDISIESDVYEVPSSIHGLRMHPDGRITDEDGEEVQPPLSLELRQFVLSEQAVVELLTWLDAYPEIECDPVLRERLDADFRYMQECCADPQALVLAARAALIPQQ